MRNGPIYGKESSAISNRQLKRAWLRLIIGLLQTMGASAGLYLLLRTGLTAATAIVLTVTLAISIVSRLVFARSSDSPPRTM